MTTALVLGMGEIGSVWHSILRKGGITAAGLDLDVKKCRGKIPDRIDVLHVCIPYHDRVQFIEAVKSCSHLAPGEIVVHSSVKPLTTEYLQQQFTCPVIYSPVRGVHSRMEKDMRRYTKYWTTDSPKTRPALYLQQLAKCRIPHKHWNGPPSSLELAKLLLDVAYYGWLIIFAQHVRVQADRYHVDEKQLWEFTDEIQQHLGNRPRMFSGDGIGGHCILQDKDLLDDAFLDAVFSHDQTYKRRYSK